MRNLLLIGAIVFFGLHSEACRRSPQAAAKAQEAAVRKYIDSQPKWSGYTVESLKGRDGIYTIALKEKGQSKRTKIQLEATTSPNCSISVDLPTGP